MLNKNLTDNFLDMLYSKQDLINAGIPLDTTIEIIYQEYKLGGLQMFPKASMSSTIRSKYSSIKTLEDLFELSPQNKNFIAFQSAILANKNTICNIYSKWNTIVVIPQVIPTPANLEESLRSFLPNYLKSKESYSAIRGSQLESTKKYCRVLEMFFDEHSSDNSRQKISDILNMTTQNVDDKLKTARKEFFRLFILGETVDNISVNPELVKMINSFNTSFQVPGTEIEMINKSGIKSPRIRELLCTILGYSTLESGTIVNKASKRDSNGHQIDLLKGKVKSLLKKEGIPIFIDDFKYLLKKNISDSQLKDSLETFVLNNHEYEIFNKNGKQYIAIKWEFLNDLDSELLRILYDFDAWNPARALSRKQLKSEWESRAKSSGRDAINYTPQYKHWRFCPTKAGFLMLKWNKGTNFVNGQQYILNLISNNPNWTFDQILHQAQSDGYTNVYTRRSLRTYYTNAINENRVERALLYAIKILDYANESTLPYSILLKKINGYVSIGYGALNRWLIKNNRVFYVFTFPGSKIKNVKLLNSRIPLITKKVYNKGNTISAINRSTISIDWNSIRQYLELQIIETAKYPALKTGIDKMFLIFREGKSDLRPNSVFYSWLPKLINSNTMPSWEKDRIRKDILGSAEAYIRIFYSMKNGGDIDADIKNSPNYSYGKPIGLGAMMNHLRDVGLMPDFFNRYQYSKDSLELIVLSSSKAVLDARNEMAHSGSTVNLADNIMSGQIHDTLLFFMYLATEL